MENGHEGAYGDERPAWHEPAVAADGDGGRGGGVIAGLTAAPSGTGCHGYGALGLAARYDRGARRLSLLGREEIRLFRRHRDDAGAGTDGSDSDGEAGRPGAVGHGLSLARRVLAGVGAGHPADLRMGDGRL